MGGRPDLEPESVAVDVGESRQLRVPGMFTRAFHSEIGDCAAEEESA